jgi:hypothetical protein
LDPSWRNWPNRRRTRRVSERTPALAREGSCPLPRARTRSSARDRWRGRQEEEEAAGHHPAVQRTGHHIRTAGGRCRLGDRPLRGSRSHTRSRGDPGSRRSHDLGGLHVRSR